MKKAFPSEWRTQVTWKRRFYARYMGWLERLGYVVVVLVIGAFVFAFNTRVDDIITADKVAITARFENVVVWGDSTVVRALVENFAEVKKGEPILEVAIGYDAQRYLAREALHLMEEEKLIPQGKVTIVRAPSTGVFVLGDDVMGRLVLDREPFAQIRNYNDLELAPTLTGTGVANAKSEGTATLSSITVGSPNGTLVRARSGDKSFVSGQMISDDVKESIGTALKGVQVGLRDDMSFTVEEITDVQFDGIASTGQGSASGGTILEPEAWARLKATIVDGKHVATIQFASTAGAKPAEALKLIESAVRGQSVVTTNGDVVELKDLSQTNAVFKVKGAPVKDGGGKDDLKGTIVSRGFEAKMRIENPPNYLVEAVKRADRQGQTVTVKVELKTGDRPLAMLLLKRS